MALSSQDCAVSVRKNLKLELENDFLVLQLEWGSPITFMLNFDLTVSGLLQFKCSMLELKLIRLPMLV